MLFTTPELHDAEFKVLADIDALKERMRWQLHEPRRWSGSLRRLSFARAIQGSNSIEGFDAELDDAAAVALGEDPLDAGEETRLALRGYRDAMTYVLQLAQDAEFTYSTQLLKSLHFMMTSYHLQNRPGQWRQGDIFVRNDDTGRIVYTGPDVADVSLLMSELVDALDSADHGDLPSLVQGSMGHLNLVMIHPFRDGNGRMARCLQSLILARGGVLTPLFMSIEEYLGRNTADYYRVLGEVGAGAWNPHNDARPWLRFTLTAHLRQARTMLRRVKETERLWNELEFVCQRHRLPERVLVALFDAASGLRVRNSTYRAAVEQQGDEPISEQTGSRDLKELVNVGLLRPRGQARGRYYVADEEIARLRQQIIDTRDDRDDSDPFAGSR
ncbi:Fic family protein [Actinoplanes derwentensis]|uniref:Fic family protein n=1 Tax=Actinoplanes derwentensis TaxID=113562 RepID=A0A1H2CAH4_9ACTN|nr:Fic family protein [Actinoplanes derwentensis]GID89049.1 cell division protein Fic [Actinoplanes derwentensis]SDT67431.1 Fic family protein [Actinoplanes derwentensis]